MAAFLIVDVDDLLEHFRQRGIMIDLQELAVGLRGGAALAAGLVSAEKLRAIAVANWQVQTRELIGGMLEPQHVFRTAGYEVFNVPERGRVADELLENYFDYDANHEPVNELIIVSTSRSLILPLVRRVQMTYTARIRVWGDKNVLVDTSLADTVVFQPFETLLGIQTKNVAVYIDFENISISLNQNGYIVDLDHLIERFINRARSYGHVVKLSAYAPWGQRGSLPPMVDKYGQEISDDTPARLMRANIEPVYHLPGKNSADIRIARDVLNDATSNHIDGFILASGDRDFNDVLNTLVGRNKMVVVWGVNGSTSKQLETNPSITLEYIDDFTNLQLHSSLVKSAPASFDVDGGAFIPSQWSSLVIQYDRILAQSNGRDVNDEDLIHQLMVVHAVNSHSLAEDLITQAVSRGILNDVRRGNTVTINDNHPIVKRTRLITERIVQRVHNTLTVRNWDYVNYGFLLNGLSMERELIQPGMNMDDQWRSQWIDALVREQVLVRELVSHRYNPDDLVPVIKMPSSANVVMLPPTENIEPTAETEWSRIGLVQLWQQFEITAEMVYRVLVSVEQFTSFRSFGWCPLGSLHRRLKNFDSQMAFQQSVEYLVAQGAALISEYDNPLSDYRTKGISIDTAHVLVRQIVAERDTVIRCLLTLYEQDKMITVDSVASLLSMGVPRDRIELWFSIMETENVLNPTLARPGQYSLFRTHHTVNLVADARKP